MSKKPVTGEPVVNNSINLSVTQNDLVDILVQDQINELMPKLKAAREELENLPNEDDIIDEERKKDIFVDRFFSEANKKFPSLKMEAITTGANWRTSKTTTCQGKKCKSFKGDKEPEVVLASIATYRKNIYEETLTCSFGTGIECTFHVEENGVIYNIESKGVISKATHNKIKSELTKHLIAKSLLINKIFELELKVMELKFESNKLKTQFIKASLQKSEEGKNLLGMLDKLKSGKLLAA